jgi:hypothetical protein
LHGFVSDTMTCHRVRRKVETRVPGRNAAAIGRRLAMRPAAMAATAAKTCQQGLRSAWDPK